MNRTHGLTKSVSVIPPSPVIGGLLQRQCACGQHTIAGGECEGCGGKDMSLQRATRDSAGGASDSGGVPPIVNDVLRSPGQPLDANTSAFFESRFGYDFSRVRVHSDAAAAQSAHAINANAYTVGSEVVFGAGMYAPETRPGAGLLAHELAHVVQQRGLAQPSLAPVIGKVDDLYEREADAHAAAVAANVKPPASVALPSPRVQRSFVSGLLDVLLFIPRLFGLEVFPAEDLREYLSVLRRRRGPEGGLFSDNKARACVSRESEFGPYDTQTKTWLIQEMLQGWTSFLDEGAIISLLRRSVADRQQIVSGVGRDRLWSKFGGQNRRVIEALTLTAADAGDGLVGRLRNLSLPQIQDYAANVSDPALLESIRRATALANITAPVPTQATITPAGEANFTINGVRVIVGQDQINPSVGNHAFTRSNFQYAAPGEIAITPENANQPVGDFAPVDISVTIFTEYSSESAKSEQSGYGVGTRPQDVNTLRYHERAHGEGWFTFLRTHQAPVFTGTSSMLPAQFNAAVRQWNTAMATYARQAGTFALRAGDCVGTLPTDEQLRGTTFTAAICN